MAFISINTATNIDITENSSETTEPDVDDLEPTTTTIKGDPVIEAITRVITRSYREDSIIIDEVSRKIEDEIFYYTADNKFNLFDNTGKQIYFISQSYSKNYPFSVDVFFEQILE